MRLAGIFTAVLVSQAACGAGTPGARSPGWQAPPYSSHDAELFDDGIEPAAVGYAEDRPSTPQADSRLRERAQIGDGILRVRVVTVTSKQEDSGPGWLIGFHTLEKIAGASPPEGDFTLQVDSASPAAGIVRAFEGRLIGKTFLAFVREFARPASGEGRWHFHLAPDAKDQIDASRSAAALGEVR